MSQVRTKYDTLYDSLRARIEGGDYAPGQRIPSVQRIMRDNSLSQATVMRAIEKLASDNLLERRPGDGVYVKTVTQTPLKAALGLHAMALVQEMMDAGADLRGLELLPLDAGSCQTADIVSLQPLALRDEVEKGALLPLDPFLRSEPVVRERLEEVPLSYFTFNETVWALPIYASPLHLHMNLELLEGAGVKPPASLDTPDALLAFCRLLRTRGFSQPLAWGSSLHALSGVLDEHGARLYDHNTHRFDLSSPGVLAAFDWLRRLAQEAGQPLRGGAAVVRSFSEQTAPLLLWGQLAAAPAFRRGVVALPFKRHYAPSQGMGITCRCADPERAWEVLSGLVSPAGSRAMAQMEWVFPSTRQGVLAMLSRRPDLAPIYGQMPQTRDCPTTRMGSRRVSMLAHVLGCWWAPGGGWRQTLVQAEAQLNLLEEVAQAPTEGLL